MTQTTRSRVFREGATISILAVGTACATLVVDALIQIGSPPPSTTKEALGIIISWLLLMKLNKGDANEDAVPDPDVAGSRSPRRVRKHAVAEGGKDAD